jgi:protein SCO1/2
MSCTKTLLALALILTAARAQEMGYADDESIGIDERLGETIPLDLTFNDEEGEPVRLGDLVNKPTVLTLVYFRCPSICSPLMNEVARTVDKLEGLDPGRDFNLITISFDSSEGPDLAAIGKDNLLGRMEKEVPEDAWRFLTGDKENITAITRAAGFRYRKEKQDFVHAATVIFLTNEGKIVRYLGGLKLLPADVKLALLDAAEGTPRTLMQRIQKICYAYDPVGKTYVLQINRIILFFTLAVLAIFLAFLLLRRKRPAPATAREPSPEGTA